MIWQELKFGHIAGACEGHWQAALALLHSMMQTHLAVSGIQVGLAGFGRVQRMLLRVPKKHVAPLVLNWVKGRGWLNVLYTVNFQNHHRDISRH